VNRIIHTGLTAFACVVAMAWLTGCLSGPDKGGAVEPYVPVMKRTVVVESARNPGRGFFPKAKPDAPLPTGPVSTVTNRMSNQVLEQTGRVLRRGDKIQMTIYAPPEPFSCVHVVDEDGRLNIPLLGTMTVAGQSCGDAQRAIEKAYIDQKIYKMVTVIIVPPEGEYTVSGEMIRPGPYPLTRDLTLLQALGRAGRYTEWADKTKVILTRANERVEIILDDIKSGRRRDVVIIPGDVIEVPRSRY